MPDYQRLVETFCTGPLFKGLPKSSLTNIIQTGQLHFIHSGSVIFGEGDPAEGLFVLLEGQVRLMKTGLQGIETIIYIINPVVMFNETTVVDGKPNPVTAIADKDCTSGRFLLAVSRWRYSVIQKLVSDCCASLRSATGYFSPVMRI